ncbi:yeats-domain-containing protein [Lepidopterella palustris CBS 459.81]|uniref:Protein AF-9 homolog n=1 Tax=Lepidopterella palustris CBS 459.81 TaxID=1314670 RepID=A0A8E2E2Z2_9PEZI|nr:yeats-domain-containing protein [Lepidopterella palustris CBS 459.81]
MPAPSNQKRVKGKRITRNLIIGSVAYTLPPVGDPTRPKGIPDDHTKRWKIYVHQPEGDPDITVWLDKVTFELHESFENHLRTVVNPPFEINETGWGGFNMRVRLYFKPIVGEKAAYRPHTLQLEPWGDDDQKAKQEAEGMVRSEICEVVEFNEPYEALFDALTSESQWDYLSKGGKRSASALGSNGRPKRGMPGSNERSAQLPERGGDGVAFSQEQEEIEVQKIKDRMAEVDKQYEEEIAKRDAIAKRLAEIRADLGPDIAKKALQKPSSDRSRRR